MQMDGYDAWARGLRRYLGLVAEAVGVGAEACYAQLEPPIDAYIALDHRLCAFPARDAALLWEERCGWALAVETHGGADLMVLGYLGLDDVLPAPRLLTGYVRAAIDGVSVGEPNPPVLHGTADLTTRLAAYARPALVST